MRTPQEVKEIGIQRLIKTWEKNNLKRCPTAKRKEFESLYQNKLLKQVFEDKK